MTRMTPRERVLAAIHHQPFDRVPTDIWATDEVYTRLYNHFGLDARGGVESQLTLWDELQIDGIPGITPPYIGPTLKVDGEYHENAWGMGFRPQRYATGIYDEQVYYPLAEAETIADLESYRWPDPDWYDYAALPALAAQFSDRAVMCGYTAPFYYHNLTRGLELSLMDALLRPELTHYIVGRISDFFTEYHRRCFEATRGLVDVTQVTDDFGSQTGLMISPRVFDTFYRPAVQRGIDLAHAYDIIVFHHDDGDCRKLLPRLVEMGIDILNPIQWRCGDWDLNWLKAEYGDRLCFHSAVDNQQTLPFGIPDDVRREVKWLIETLASDGTGFIIGPCHNLQAVSSTENILALYEAAQEYGAFA